MSGAKEIRTKIKSIKSTQKITSAMEMVAASKMRKAQLRMLGSRPYFYRIRNVIEHLSEGHSEYRHPYLLKRETKRVGVVVVSTDRGLCGGLNANNNRYLLSQMAAWQKADLQMSFCAVGTKAEAFLRRMGANILAVTTKLGDTPEVADIVGSVSVMLKAYENKEIDELYICYNQFINTMSQKPKMQQLLPITPEMIELETKSKTSAREYAGRNEDTAELSAKHWDYIYEPDAKELLDLLMTRFMESQVYHAVVENFACEQAARMVAMKSASENAGDIINRLELQYNKARQASITQELSEIVGGAAAV